MAANKARGYGLSAECAKKKAAKWDADLATETLQWIADVLNTSEDDEVKQLADTLIIPATSQEDVHGPLKTGILLCHLVNLVTPGSVKKINKAGKKFPELENIGSFTDALVKLGCNKTDLFQSVDLHEADNIPAVVSGIGALARKAAKENPSLPTFGPAEATENKREFTDEQLAEGQNIIGLQMGSNKGASQAGQNFGKTRNIID